MTPGTTIIFRNETPAVPAAAPPSLPPVPSMNEIDRLVADAAERLDDEHALLVVSDALMERGDPRGRLIAFMLEEERGSELMRKVKANVLIRDHAAQWAPPGATITAFHRGLPSELEWHGPTDPHHVAWRSARVIVCNGYRLPAPSPFTVPRPRLKRVSGLDRKLFDELLAAAPPNLEAVSASISDEPQAESVARARARLPRLAFVRLESTNARFDDSLGEGPLRAVMQAARGLKGLQLSLPRLSLATIDACLALAPQLEVQLLTPWLERISRAPADLRIDPRRRQICLPPRVWLDAQLRTSLAEVGAILGEELSVIEESSAAR